MSTSDAPAPPPVDTRRFPALARLSRRGAGRIPFVQQMESADCGAACLAMVLAHHGHAAPLGEVRRAAGTSGGGTSASGILRAAGGFGLRGRGLRVEVSDLAHLPAGTILHWELNHFVVLERVDRRGVHIVDPALGRRCLSPAQVGRALTGVAIELTPKDDFARRPAGAGPTMRFLRQLVASSGGFQRIVVISLLLQLFALAVPMLTGLVVDRVVPRADRHLLTIVGLGLAGLIVFQALAQVVRAHLFLQMRTNLDTRMTLGFLSHLVSLPYAFFQRRSTGDLLLRVASNQTIREILSSQALSALLDGGLVTLYLGLVLLADARLALLVTALGALQVVLVLAARRSYKELEARGIEARSRAQSYLVQLLGGIATLKLAGAEGSAVERYSQELAGTLDADLALGRTSAVVEAIQGGLRTAAPALVLAYGATRVLAGELTLGTMLAVNSLAAAFLTPVASLAQSLLSLERVRGHLERLEDVLDVAPEQAPGRRAPPRLTGRIELDRVSFRYGEGLPLALREVSLAIEPGTHVAIVGASGSGKSTLASILLGLHPVGEGRVLFDGRSLAELDLEALRAQLGTVPQTPFFFDASVRDNIALGAPDTPLDQVVAAARLACIHDDIAAMPMGYEALLADRGQSLSGGQRQRLALARALVTRPAVLVLDEATSALDTRTEARVTAELRRLRMTRVTIAHRLSTVLDADRIIVMAEGRIVQSGTHQELVAQDGLYRALVRAQLEAGPGRSTRGEPEDAALSPAPASSRARDLRARGRLLTGADVAGAGRR